MTGITDLGASTWRDYVTDGVPSSGIRNTPKSEARTFAAAVDLQKAQVVDTQAAFEALTSAPDAVLIKGKAAAYDGAWGGVFVRVAGSTTPADGAMVLRRAAGGDSYKRALPGEDLEASWFNFKADGLSASGTANTAALQAAVAFGILTHTQVRLPIGVAYLATAVTISDALMLRGRGWNTVLKPVSDATTILFNVTGASVEIHDVKLDGGAVVSPTNTGLKVNNDGFFRESNLHIVGFGIGIDFPKGNACRFADTRIQACPVCVKTGGVSGSYPGDTTWSEVVMIPTATGTGMIIDGNTNAQYMHRVQIVGGAMNLNIRGGGASTDIPDGILQSDCNYTASSGPVVQILKGRNVQFNNSVIGGSTGDDGILINPASPTDVDGILIDGSQVRANYKRGVNWQGGANLQITGGQVNGNSDGGGAGVYSNVYVGANAIGLFQMIGVMAGLSASGEIFANIQAPAKYGVELAPGALTDATNFPGRVIIMGCMLDGNTTGMISDGSAPTGFRKIIDTPPGRRTLKQSGVASSVSGTTSETVVGYINVPAGGWMGANGAIDLDAVIDQTGSAGTMSLTVRIVAGTVAGTTGGTALMTNTVGTGVRQHWRARLFNLNNASLQGMFCNGGAAHSATSNGLGASAINTNNAFTISINLVMGSALDTGTLRHLGAEVKYAA